MPERAPWTFPFFDPRWLEKVGVGTLLVLASLIIPLVPLLFLAGYCLEINRRIILGDGHAVLPEWRDWDGLLRNGFRFSEASLVYALPGLLLMTAGSFLAGYPILATRLISLLSSSLPELTASGHAWINVGLWVLGSGTVLSLAGGLVSIPAAMHMVAHDSVPAVFRFKEWWAILAAVPGAFVLPYLVVTACLVVLTVVFSLLSASLVFCLPGAFLFSAGSTLLSLVASALFASAYRAGVDKLQGVSH